PRRAPVGTRFAYAERREVVVEHERLRDFLTDVDGVDPLLVARRPERHHTERLGLAAREERRAVGARKHAHFGRDLADVVEAPTVGPLPPLEDVAAHGLLLDGPQDLADFLLVVAPVVVL